LKRPSRRSPADGMQTGLCDISIAAHDITAPLVVPTEDRPPKRPFAEIDEEVGQEPNSDEYGWIEDDDVDPEGLLIDEAPITEDVDSAAPGRDVVIDSHKKKVSRTSTI
jgi:hypothetical protein